MTTTKIRPFRINFEVAVLCEGFESLEGETVDEARDNVRKELQAGLRQTAYALPWEVTDWTFEEVEGDD